MAYAIDQASLERGHPDRPVAEADSMFANDSKWYAETDYPTFDLDKAKSWCSEYEAEKGPIKFVLGTTTDPVDPASRAGRSRACAQAAGMDVTVKSFEQSAYITNAVTGDYTAQMWRQFGAPDPDGDYVWFIGANATGALP